MEVEVAVGISGGAYSRGRRVVVEVAAAAAVEVGVVAVVVATCM